jgi:hypothetical protein
MTSSIRPQARSYCARFFDLAGVDVVADRQFLGGDDAFGLVADVEQDLVAVDLHDRPLEDVPLLEVPQRGLDRLAELVGGEVPHLARRLDLNQLLPRTKRAPTDPWDSPGCWCASRLRDGS